MKIKQIVTMQNRHEEHLDIYGDKYILYHGTKKAVYRQGCQDARAKERFAHIKAELAAGYLDKTLESISDTNFEDFPPDCQKLILNLVNGITSEVGRALVGLTILQLTIKSIEKEQDIRLHKGNTMRGKFSWVDGIAMRSLDQDFNTPFLRKHGLLKLNNYGVFMTRSLAENYPYSRLYKAEMRGPFSEWIDIVDSIENECLNPQLGLSFILSLLQNRSQKFAQDAQYVCDHVSKLHDFSFSDIKTIIKQFFNDANYSARAFEITIHAFMQALSDIGLLEGLVLVPLSQMRSANKKHGNVGDVELKENSFIVESWDAKYGKPYLRDELEELRDKLENNTEVRIAGFICNIEVEQHDVLDRKEEIATETDTEIVVCSFDEWIEIKTQGIDSEVLQKLGYAWVVALVESLAQRRPSIAPIDEPCEAWINDWKTILDGV